MHQILGNLTEFLSISPDFKYLVTFTQKRFSSMKKLAHIFFFLILSLSSIEICLADPFQSDTTAAEFNELAKKYRGNDFDREMYFAQRALVKAKEENNEKELALANKNIGIIHWLKFNLDSALQFYKTSLHQFKQLEDKIEVANLYNNISLILDRRMQSDSALTLIEMALELNFEANDSIGIAINYSSLGRLYGDRGNSEGQVEYYKKSLIYDKSGEIKAFNYNNLAAVMHKIHGPDSGLFYLSLALNENYSRKQNATIMMNMCGYFLEMKEIDSARLYLAKGRAFVGDDLNQNYTSALINEGDILVYEGFFLRALKKYKELLQVADSRQLILVKVDALSRLAKTYKKLNQWEEAYTWFDKYSILNDSLRDESNSQHYASLQAVFEYEKNQRKISDLTVENLKKEVEVTRERSFRNRTILVSSSLVLTGLILWLLYRRKEERKKAALEQKRLEIEQRMLRSQMNPHFIFNALNSIQSFITTNNTYEAEVFMSKFSMLVRKILENSTHKYISLGEEVETLRLYLELEKSRFEERFDFEIKENADSMLSIPPMLMQPFVENAIIHGMKDKADKGHISVRFVEEENCLRCEVEDDGAGRKNTTKEITHKSLATSLTNDRISYFNETSKSAEYNLQIIDLINDQGSASGTKVVLTTPLVA